MPTQMTLEEVITKYLAEEAIHHVAHNTLVNHTVQLGLWRQRIGHLWAHDLTPPHIAEVQTELLWSRKHATVNRYVATLSAVMSYAERMQYVSSNPARSVRRLPVEQQRTRVLSEAEEACLLNYTSESRLCLHELIISALETGARRSELTNLKWAHVNMDDGAMTFVETKNKMQRTVPISTKLQSLLMTIDRRNLGPADLVFAPFKRTEWLQTLRQCNINDFLFHDLRHTFASRCAAAGHNTLMIAQFLGHKDIKMTQHYTHLSVSNLRSLVT